MSTVAWFVSRSSRALGRGWAEASDGVWVDSKTSWPSWKLRSGIRSSPFWPWARAFSKASCQYLAWVPEVGQTWGRAGVRPNEHGGPNEHDAMVSFCCTKHSIYRKGSLEHLWGQWKKKANARNGFHQCLGVQVHVPCVLCRVPCFLKSK